MALALFPQKKKMDEVSISLCLKNKDDFWWWSKSSFFSSVTKQNDEFMFTKWSNGKVTFHRFSDSSAPRKTICLFSSNDSEQSLELNLHAIGYFFSSKMTDFLFIKYMPGATRFFTHTPVFPFDMRYIVFWCVCCVRFIGVVFIPFFVGCFRISGVVIYFSSGIS